MYFILAVKKKKKEGGLTCHGWVERKTSGSVLEVNQTLHRFHGLKTNENNKMSTGTAGQIVGRILSYAERLISDFCASSMEAFHQHSCVRGVFMIRIKRNKLDTLHCCATGSVLCKNLVRLLSYLCAWGCASLAGPCCHC